MNFLLIFLGGGLGSLMRYSISLLFAKISYNLPIATLSSNVLSCLLFGCILNLYNTKANIPDNYKQFILIGICGGLSTFSTFSFESIELIKQGLYSWAIANILISCTLCMGIFFIFSK